MRLLMLSLLGVLAATPGLHAQDADAVIGRAARVYRSLGGLKAEFVQEINDPMIGRFESRGTLLQAGDNRFAMQFSDPAGDAIVVDGQHIWVYTPSTTPGQVLKMDLPSGGPVYGYNLLAWFLDRPAERYRATYLRRDQLNGRSVDVVELIPRSSEMPFRRAVIWLDRDAALPRRLEIEERSGTSRTLTLTEVQPDAPIPAGAFTFEAPDGVRVIER